MGIESKINDILNQTPAVKRIIKRAYQRSMYLISPKLKSEGDIQKISPDDGYEYFFGYYDKSPWNSTDRYILSLRAKDTATDVSPLEAAEIVMFDTQDNNRMHLISSTQTWNVQQGCMLQWLVPDFDDTIIFNDYRENRYCSVIINVHTKEERVLPMPVYSVSSDGKFALTLDFSRLHRLRKGYGYANLEETTRDEKLPQSACVWRMDLESGTVTELLAYTDFAQFEPREEMSGAEHKVNHIMLNPSNNRFMVLHRWFNGQRKYSRLVTVNIDGTDMYNLSDDDMISHCFWKNDSEIIAYERKQEFGNGYFLMVDQTPEFKAVLTELTSDGHPSYSPNRQLLVTDTYPDRARVAKVMVAEGETIKTVARVFAPFKYDNDLRCDLHPRWNRAGTVINFDSVFEGKRGLYTVSVADE